MSDSNISGRKQAAGGLLYLLILVLSLNAGLSWHGPSGEARSRPIPLASAPAINPEALVTVVEQGKIPAIDDPRLVSASEAEFEMDRREKVIGVVINGDARAYPIKILARHEIVNDVVGGEPIAVTWCPLCYTALVFSRRLPSEPAPLTFGVSGKLLYNTLVMYDWQTRTLWSQLYGTAVAGPLVGKTLAVFPSLLTEWAAWLEAHPRTLVLSKRLTQSQFAGSGQADDAGRNYAVDPYVSYYRSAAEGLVDAQIPREEGQAQPKERVLGVRIGQTARSYPFRLLTAQPVINDQLGTVPVVIWFDPSTQTGAAYERRDRGRVLTFQTAPDASGLMADVETGSLWRGLTGEAVAGPLRGQRLPPLPATPAFAFAWRDYFPQGDTYSPQ